MTDFLTLVEEMKDKRYVYSLQYFNRRMDGPYQWVAAFKHRDHRVDATEYVGVGLSAQEATRAAYGKFVEAIA